MEGERRKEGRLEWEEEERASNMKVVIRKR